MINIENLNPFPKFCCSIGMIPTSYKVSYSYEEQLLWLCDFLENTVIPTVNNNGQAVEELQNLFVTLTNYVNNYFDNLDVQEEINNKLDEMAESGVLQEIINSYLQIKSLITFDTVNDMKNSTNLTDGSFAQTLGYYTLNDNGKAIYKIREKTLNDNEDGGKIHFLTNNLVAEIVYNNALNVKQFGATGDGVTDDTQHIQNALNSFNYIYFPDGNYKVSSLNIPNGCILEGENKKSKIIVDNTISIGNSSSPAYNVTILNLDFKGDTNYLLNITNTYYLTIENCSFSNTNININNTAILINANYNVAYFTLINNCVFSNFNKAIIIQDGANANKISNSTFYNCNRGIDIDNSNSITINNNYFQNFLQYGVYINNTNENQYTNNIVINENYFEGYGNNLVTGVCLNSSIIASCYLIGNRYYGLVPTYPEIINNSSNLTRLEWTGADPGTNYINLPGFVNISPRPKSWKNYNTEKLFGTLQVFADEHEAGQLCLLNRVWDSTSNSYQRAWEEIPTFRNNLTSFANKQINGGVFLPTEIDFYYNKILKLANGDVQGQGNLFFDTTKNTLKTSDGTSFSFYQKVYSNTSTNRMSNPATGMMMFDTTLGKPIWYNGSNWVDSTGTTV